MVRGSRRSAWIRERAAFLMMGAALAAGCDGNSAGNPDEFEELDLSVCDPDNGPFTLEIDNPFFPLPVGHHLVLEGDEDGVTVRVEITVLDETLDVGGVTTRVMEEAESEDGEVIEISRNFFAQAPDGTVCYFGEAVDDYEDGQVVGHEGAWRADEPGNAPGIIMPGDPRPGTKFAQELAPGVAEDMSAIVAIGESVSVPAGDFENALRTADWNPLEGQSSADGEEKVYVQDIGVVVDGVVELIER